MDAVLGALLLTPYRCLDCRSRFFRPYIPWSKPAVAPSQAPLLAAPQAAPPKKGPAPDSPATRFDLPRSVLILDSDPAVRRLLRRLIERKGYFVAELAQPTELLTELRSRRVDLLIADFGVPRQMELETMATLARAHPGLRIIGLSSEPIEAGLNTATRLVLPKPLHIQTLLESVDSLLQQADADRLRIQPDPPEVAWEEPRSSRRPAP